MGTRTVIHVTAPDPNDPHTMVATGAVQIIDTRDLADAQNDALARLDLQFNSLVNGGRNYNGKNFQIDDNSRLNIAGAAQMASIALAAQQAYSQAWIATDNTTVTFDGAGMIAFGVNVGIYYSALVLANRTAKDAITACTTVAACDAFDVTQGWPVN